MDTKKLNKWAELLLDTGKRNSLINFKDSKASAVEVIFPAAKDLFEKIRTISDFEVYDPKIAEENEEDGEKSEAAAETEIQKRHSYFEQYSAKIKKSSQLLLYNAAQNPVTALKNIDKRADEFTEETGVNVAYMAFGFINWTENASGNAVFHAPLLLTPVLIERGSASSPFIIKPAEDETVLNPTFAFKLEAEQGIKLPEYNDEGLEDYLLKVNEMVKRLHWSVSAQCKIGIFSFLKINMYRDLKDNEQIILQNPNIRLLLGEKTDTDNVADAAPEKALAPLTELHSVVDADSSQIEAIKMAKSGKSFVLQGPPGTGKSQTITNIIAECLGDGKKVLFVSEKLAALNVVYDKLKQAGLSEFCLELHSHKAGKREVIADINRALHAGVYNLSSKAKEEIKQREKAEAKLDAYAYELHKERPVVNMSLYELYEGFAANYEAPDCETALPKALSEGGAYLTEAVSLLEQYASFVPTIGFDYRKNPWYGYINADSSHQGKTRAKSDMEKAMSMLEILVPLSDEIALRYGFSCDNIRAMGAAGKLFSLISAADVITPSLLVPEQFQKSLPAIQKLQALSKEVISAEEGLNRDFDKDIYKIDGENYRKKLTALYSGFISHIFNGEYKEIMKTLRMCRRDGKKLSYAEAVETCGRVSEYQQKLSEYNSAEAPIKSALGGAYTGVHTDWSVIINHMNALNEAFDNVPDLGGLSSLTPEGFSSQKKNFSVFGEKISLALAGAKEETSRLSQCFDNKVLDIGACGLNLLAEKLGGCLSDMEHMDNWHSFRLLLTQLEQADLLGFTQTAIDSGIEANKLGAVFKKQFYRLWIDSVISGVQELSSFSRITQDKTIADFSEKDKKQFEINKLKIRSLLSSQRPSLDIVAGGSALAVLLREGEKKRKQKSIRTLLSETGDLVQRVKPCFLMSPLSVSTFLTADAIHFDVAVFDEASQIFPQDAVGAIYRADRLIVVGDSKQMPPSDFFNARTEAEEADEEAGDVTDFESVLDICSASMKQLRLRWHYRSRYEQLIAFSNKNFYDGDLVTFPSSRADGEGVGVDYYHVDGIMDRKTHTNRREAEFVVELIYKNIEKYPSRSLGVVAFSKAQQELIDRLLSKRRQELPEKEYFFKSGAKEPFFVKNLETVQGDERDTIIFSVAYGFDESGQLRHNFGPLNRAGGERRLNVAVTRAKQNVQLVSSMRHTDIDLSRTSSVGAMLLKEYLDYAENGSAVLERSVSASGNENTEFDLENQVCEFLRSHGYDVDTRVGCSDLKIDIALKRPDSPDYVLAIECDGASYHSSRNARDRDRLRKEILERMGWRYYRIWSTDWFRNRAVEQEKLLKAVKEALSAPKAAYEPIANEEKKEDTAAAEAPKDTTEILEKASDNPRFEFPKYKAADVNALIAKGGGYLEMVKAVLEAEAPLSEDLLLKRTLPCFGREKITSAVRKDYEQKMSGCERLGITRRKGFLYLDNGKEITFRTPGDIEREIKQIAPEELAAGMYEILKQNVSVDKDGLYLSVLRCCGISRRGSSSDECLDEALLYLGSKVEIDAERITLK